MHYIAKCIYVKRRKFSYHDNQLTIEGILNSNPCTVTCQIKEKQVYTYHAIITIYIRNITYCNIDIFCVPLAVRNHVI